MPSTHSRHNFWVTIWYYFKKKYLMSPKLKKKLWSVKISRTITQLLRIESSFMMKNWKKIVLTTIPLNISCTFPRPFVWIRDFFIKDVIIILILVFLIYFLSYSRVEKYRIRITFKNGCGFLKFWFLKFWLLADTEPYLRVR